MLEGAQAGGEGGRAQTLGLRAGQLRQRGKPGHPRDCLVEGQSRGEAVGHRAAVVRPCRRIDQDDCRHE